MDLTVGLDAVAKRKKYNHYICRELNPVSPIYYKTESFHRFSGLPKLLSPFD